MSFPIANVPVNEGLFSPKVKAEILSKIEPLVTNCKGDRERLAAWFFDEETLIREDIQYSGFLELDEFVDAIIVHGLEEARILRQEIHHIWKELGAVFRVFWLHWMNSAQREGLLINALLHTAGTPNGDELRRYLLDFDCASLCANNGKALLTYIRGVVDPERRDENTPALSDKLNLVFTGWKRANNTCDDVAEHKSLYLTHLKSRCLFARDIFGCRVMFRLLEMWQSLVSPYIPRKVADAKPLGIENNYDGTFRVVNALGHLLPSISATGSRKSSKKSKGRGRGQKAKLEYQVRKKENRERRVQSNGSMDNTGNAKAHMSHIREVSDDTVSLSSNTCTHNQNSPQEAFNNSMIVDGMNESKVPETASQAECAQPADTESAGLAIDIDGPKCSDFDDPKSHDISDEAIVFDASSHPNAPSNDSFEIPTINILCETLPQLSSQENVQEILPAAHERTVDVPVDINDYHSHKLASSLVEQVLDVPELLDEGSTGIGTNGKPVFDIPRPTSPSTPILGQSPVVKILSDDLVLDSDTFSLSVSTIYSASTQSNVAVVDIENKQGTTSDNDYPTSIAEGQLTIEEPVALGTPIKEGITSEGDLPTPVVDDYTIAEHLTPIHYSLYHSTEQNVFGGSVAVKKKVCGPAKVYIAVPDHIFKKKSSQITNLEANPVITRATIMVASKIKTKSKKKKKPTNGQQQSLGSPVLPQPSEKDFLNTQHILNKSPPFTIQEAVSKPVSEGHKTPTPATEHSLPVSEENTTGSGLSDCPEFKEIVLMKDDINASSEAELVDCSSKPEVKESSTLVPISIRTTADPSNTSEPTKESSTLISEEKRIFVVHPYASQYPAELSIPIANQRFGPTISEDGLFIEDANIQGRSLKKNSTTFVDRVQQFSEKSCSQNSSRRSSGSGFLVQTQAGHSKSSSLSSSDAMSRRKSQIRAGSFEDQVRQMLISSQDSPKLPSQLVSPNNQPAPNLPPSNATIPVDWMTTHCHGQFGSQSQYRVHPGQSNHKYHVAQVTAYPLLHPDPPPPFFNGSDYPPCHQAIFHHEPSIGEEHGYFGSSKVPAELNAIVQKVPIASVTFQCNTCNKHLSDHNSIICPMCGINSHTRFCDEECRYASGFHWKCCGINSLPYQTDHVVPPYSGPWRTTGSMNVYRFWHPTILYDYPGFDFLIFDDGLIYNESPKILRAIIFSEQPLRDRFHAVYKRAVWDFDEFCVRLLWRVVRAWLKVCYWEDITIELLSRQFELEFGPGWINSRNGDLPENFPTEEEWAKVEEYLDRKLEHEGYTNTKAVTTKLPLVWKEPRVPDHISNRISQGGATPTGFHVWY